MPNTEGVWPITGIIRWPCKKLILVYREKSQPDWQIYDWDINCPDGEFSFDPPRDTMMVILCRCNHCSLNLMALLLFVSMLLPSSCFVLQHNLIVWSDVFFYVCNLVGNRDKLAFEVISQIPFPIRSTAHFLSLCFYSFRLYCNMYCWFFLRFIFHQSCYYYL